MQNGVLLATDAVGSSYDITRTIQLTGSFTYVRAEVRDASGSLLATTEPIFFETTSSLSPNTTAHVDGVTTPTGTGYTRTMTRGITSSAWDGITQRLGLNLTNQPGSLSKLIVTSSAPPQQVIVDGQIVPYEALPDAQTTSSWYYDSARGEISVTVLQAGPTSSVSLDFSPLLFTDGFEGGNLGKWTTSRGVSVGPPAHTGADAARLTGTGAPTFAAVQLVVPQPDIYYQLWFQILAQGPGSVRLLKLRTAANVSLITLGVLHDGRLYYNNDVAHTARHSTTAMSVNAWHQVQLHLTVNGTSDQTEVWLDGVRLTELSTAENLGSTPVGIVQIGDNAPVTTYDLLIDDVTAELNLIPS
jgi:hypothetical protein